MYVYKVTCFSLVVLVMFFFLLLQIFQIQISGKLICLLRAVKALNTPLHFQICVEHNILYQQDHVLCRTTISMPVLTSSEPFCRGRCTF